jgi:hypothetical protein
MTRALPLDIAFCVLAVDFQHAMIDSTYEEYIDTIGDSSEFAAIKDFEARYTYITQAGNDIHAAYCAYPA